MKYFFRLIRLPLGQLIILINQVTLPKAPDPAPGKQQAVDADTASMSLYQLTQCPFCVKTRRTIRRLGLNVETRNAGNNPHWNQKLIDQGGKYQVSCLAWSKKMVL